MVQIAVDVDKSELEEIRTLMQNGFINALPETATAFNLSVELVRRGWKDWVTGKGSLKGIPNNEFPNSKLAESIKTRENGLLDKTIYSNSPQMERLQKGSPKYDMKNDAYLRGNKSRISEKDKTPYLIIPFKWGTPNDKGTRRAHFRNVIPVDLYPLMLKFKKSKIEQEKRIEKNARGIAILRNTYTWGDRLNLADKKNYASGMVRMRDDSTGNAKYLTFRVISAKSPKDSWIRKAKPGINIEQALKNTYEKIITEMVEDAIKQDL